MCNDIGIYHAVLLLASYANNKLYTGFFLSRSQCFIVVAAVVVIDVEYIRPFILFATMLKLHATFLVSTKMYIYAAFGRDNNKDKF